MIRTLTIWSTIFVVIVLNLTLFSEFPAVFIWGSVMAWNITAALFFVDSLRVHLHSRKELNALDGNANGRRLVAKGRYVISDWFLNGAALGLLAGLISAYRLTLSDLDSPIALMTGTVVRVIIIIMFVCFWRAKRENLKLYERARVYYRSLLAKKAPSE